MLRILQIAAAVAWAASGPLFSAMPAAAEQGAAPPVVVELFTSQGCSSCPPAEALLHELADAPGIIALELHVDYWDYIGWADPFAMPEMTERQRGYARSLQERYVFTPQMIIDGRSSVVGSRRSEVAAAIDEASARGKAVAPRLSTEDGGKIIIPAGHSPSGGATVWLATYDDRHETAVLSGENAGRTLENRRIVRELVPLGRWTGEAMEIPVALAAAAARGRAGCAVLVQQGRTGPILGATQMALPGS